EKPDGTFHYDLSRNVDDGVQQVREARAAVRVSDAQVRSPALEGNPVDINLEFASPEVNTDPAFTEDASRAVTRRLVAEVAKVLPGTKVGVRLVRQLHSLKDGSAIMGRANPDGSIEVSASAGRDEAGAVGILNHEIIHVLRNADLWRSPEGLFTGREWSRLVAAAEANPDLVAAVNANYKGKGLTRDQMQEEYVAEMYRGWKAQTGDYGAVERILLKIEEFFRALASAFRGEGFDSAGRIMQRIADGGIGGRGPSGPGRGVRSGAMGAVPAEMRAFHGSPHLFDKFSLSAIGTGEGAQAFGWGLYFAGRREVAEYYRDSLANRGASDVIVDTAEYYWGGDAAQAIASLERVIAAGSLDARQVGYAKEAIELIREGWTPDTKGRLFEVEIPDDKDLLDWDAKLTDQSESVRVKIAAISDILDDKQSRMEARSKIYTRPVSQIVADWTGADLYDAVKDYFTMEDAAWDRLGKTPNDVMNVDQAASEFLRAAGIPGHRYLDGGSRADGDGSRNYVIYDEAAIDVVGMEMRAGGNPDPIAYPSVVNSLSKLWSRKPATSEAALNAKEGSFVSNLITNAMASNDKYNSLGLVPGEVLFRDLGKNLPSAGKWVKTMRQMTSERQEMHAEADVLAREWQGAYVKDKVNGRKLHDLMHESTIEEVDPSERFRAPRRPQDMTDAEYMNFVEERRNKHAELRQKFNALPENMQAIYRKARDAYKEFDSKLIDAMVDAVVKAMDLQADRLKARYEGELQQFRDDGLEGDALKEAQKKARSRFNQDVKMLEFSRNARIRKMRLTYEANRIEGPYFPLMRFGQFFVAARDDKGKLVHFERATTAGAMNRIEAEMKDAGFVVEKGVMKPDDNMSRFVDPNFVADITESLGEAGADSQILDAIYQRYLETLPSFSIRKANIHRQGVPGFDKDAIKAFGSRMFHGAHQLTRLRHSMDLTKHIENARREAKRDRDPVRAGALVNEMQKRHDWSMNPQGAQWSAWATSTAFVWYLGLTPGAAIVNLTQTTVVGIPLLAAG
ncbi:PLxRFG domain-containing protein, partial [Yoonia sp.]|uniref:PLxRFG domain-containing protein n=1 Tax=Yoonia sp. TaxID=2212373 RepID=UPI002DFC813A|nr:PLxRFG domain-containing protein [Yoonia sp.]